MTNKTPRSIRLNKTHRDDMVNAVMAEWEKQNPPPAGADYNALLEIVAEQLKKHPVQSRTRRCVEHFTPDDWNHVGLESCVNVQIRNAQGTDLRTMQVRFPASVADRLGLARAPSTVSSLYEGYAEGTFAAKDIDAVLDDDRVRVNTAQFVERNYPMVVIQDDAPPMVAHKAAREARKEWKAEYTRLRRETADLLDQFSSTKQLREGWPDMVPYLPPHIADPDRAVTLPVLATSRLSERLGIKE
jgi:hypothetical protein